VLVLTQRGRAGPPPWDGALIPAAGPPSARRESGLVVPDAPYDLDCFERLRAWRLQQARADQIAPFMVFSDATLRALAALPPNGLGPTTLAMVPGIGPAKLARYGDALLSLLQGAAEAPDGTK
jgi:DNA helicase-2/ATP-dependent DNA helicase PcrA